MRGFHTVGSIASHHSLSFDLTSVPCHRTRDQLQSIKYNHQIANLVIFHNCHTIMLALKELEIKAQTITGTYAVNSDCTGTLTVTSTTASGTQVEHQDIVVDLQGLQVRGIATDPGWIATSLFQRQ